MLTDIREKYNVQPAAISISEVDFPSPFKSTLEFNPPVHGMWNIVHTGMLIPDSHQIYICSANCMRGVVLTAAEMNAMGRFSQVLIKEKDVLAGSIERLTVDGVCDVLKKLDYKPKAVLTFTVCVHHFLGSDLDWIYSKLKRRNPDVMFIRCFMDPIMRKSGPSPDQKMRKSLYEPIKALPENKRTVTVLGSDFALDEDSDIKTLLKSGGFNVLEIAAAKSFDEYMKTGESSLFITCYPQALYGARALSKRLGRPLLYMPMTFNMDEIDQNEKRLCLALGIAQRDSSPLRDSALSALRHLKNEIKDTRLAIDYTFHPRPLSLARLLLDNGFNVAKIYLDVISDEEKRDFYYLKENYPGLLLCSNADPGGRLAHGGDTKTLALGQKAAWFTGTRHFVNIVEGAGWYGYDGIIKLCRKAQKAFQTEKEPEDILPRKGLGCESCF